MPSEKESNRVYFIPLAISILFPLTFITSYSIALAKDHINPFFAYISDTGTFPPEMNIFGLMLCFAGVLLGVNAYVRFMQIKVFFNASSEYEGKIAKWNKIGLVFGIISGIGAAVVGNFQENSVLAMHVIGASMAFGGGSTFLIIQAWFSFKLLAFHGTKFLATVRMVLSCCCLLLFVTSLLTGMISTSKFTGDNFTKWEPEDGGWALRVISVVTEWVMASFLVLYFITFIPEFKKISLTSGPRFALRNMADSRTQNGSSSRQKVMMQRVGTEDV